MDSILLIGGVVFFIAVVAIIIFNLRSSSEAPVVSSEALVVSSEALVVSSEAPAVSSEAPVEAETPRAANDPDAWKCNNTEPPNARWGPCKPGEVGSCSACTAEGCGCRKSNRNGPATGNAPHPSQCFRCLTDGDCKWAAGRDPVPAPYKDCAAQ
jgi:hypothetical protein